MTDFDDIDLATYDTNGTQLPCDECERLEGKLRKANADFRTVDGASSISFLRGDGCRTVAEAERLKTIRDEIEQELLRHQRDYHAR